MNTTRSDQLIEQYLERLAGAAGAMPPAERDDLVSDIREHITVALDEEEHVDEAAVRNLLVRLGSPEDVVEAATGGTTRPAAPPLPTPPSGGGVEAAALLTLVLSPLVPLFGWIVGAVLASASRTWSRREKLVALAGIPAAAVAIVAVFWFVPLPTSFALFEDAFTFFSVGNVATILLMGPAGAAYLAWRRRAVVADADADASTPGGPLEWAAVVVLLLSWSIPVLGWVAGAVMVGTSRRWSRREKQIGIVAIPLAIVLAAAALYALHLPGVDLPIDSPIQPPSTPGTVPVFAMGPVGAAYLAWRLMARLQTHRRTNDPVGEPA
jgi:hypothetical protein